ncbi:MAG: MFS transporter [Thermodesulfobacteriota bacterium]
MKRIQSPHRYVFLGGQYSLYFGVLGIFLPYFNLYCHHLRFSGFEIGILSAIRTVATVLFPLFWGALADRYKTRRPIYIGCNFISALAWGLFLLTSDFHWMLVISLVYGFFYAPLISFLEAFTMDILGAERNRYGRIRMWGSIHFIAAVMLVGWLIDLYSVDIVIMLIFAGSLLQAVVSCGIPRSAPSAVLPSAAEAPRLLKGRLIVFLICAFIMLVSHGMYYGFFSIHLEALGYGKTFVGIAWGLASLAEIVVMIKSEAIFRRFSIEKVLLVTFAAAVARWLILAFASSPAVILASQALHALTYGAFHVASILYIDRIVPAEAKTVGQAVNNAVTYGLGITIGFVVNGYLFDRIGAFGLFAFSAGVALFGGLLFGGFLAVDPRFGYEEKP